MCVSISAGAVVNYQRGCRRAQTGKRPGRLCRHQGLGRDDRDRLNTLEGCAGGCPGPTGLRSPLETARRPPFHRGDCRSYSLYSMEYSEPCPPRSAPGSRTPGIWWHSGSARSAGTRTTRSASPKWSGPTEDRRGGKGPEGSRESDETIYFPMCDANSQAGALSGRGDDHPSGGRARCRSVRRVLACLREAARTHRGSPRASCA